MEKLRESLLKSARDFYEQLVRQESADLDLRAERGRAYGRLGTISTVTSRTDEAEAAIGIRERLTTAHPDVPQYQIDLAGSYLNLSTICGLEGKNSEAERLLLNAVKLQDVSPPRIPTSRNTSTPWPRAGTT